MRECTIDQSCYGEYLGIGLGLHPGQSGVVYVHGGWEKDGDSVVGCHDTFAAVHVSVTRDGRIVVGVENDPEHYRLLMKLPRWRRVYRYWKHHASKTGRKNGSV